MPFDKDEANRRRAKLEALRGQTIQCNHDILQAANMLPAALDWGEELEKALIEERARQIGYMGDISDLLLGVWQCAKPAQKELYIARAREQLGILP
jgi:hypothetical protein